MCVQCRLHVGLRICHKPTTLITMCVCVQTWDEGLAVTARAWARFCVFEHNIYLRDEGRMHPTFTSVGENIWAGASYTQFNVTSAIKLWVDEVKDYNYHQKQCTKVCGHYTQVHTQISRSTKHSCVQT